MNTMIEGGRDQKLTSKLQRLQGIAVKESASERALKTDFFAKVREFGHRLGLTHAMQVGDPVSRGSLGVLSRVRGWVWDQIGENVEHACCCPGVGGLLVYHETQTLAVWRAG